MSDPHDKDYYLAKAEQCFRLAKFCTDAQVAAQLRELGHEFIEQALKLGANPPFGYVPRAKQRGT